MLVARATDEAEARRPRILGVAHMALYVSDLQKARAFYKDLLGYEEPYTLKREDGSDRIAHPSITDICGLMS
jgi:catechol-2,3-dioxygenase